MNIKPTRLLSTRLWPIAITLAFACAPITHADEIRVLNWQGYGTDQDWAIAAFTEATGHTVVHEYFNSEQEMLTKMRTNPGAYDAVLINSAFTRQARDEGLIGPINTTAIPNFANVAPNMATNEDMVFDGEVYGVAWTWG